MREEGCSVGWTEAFIPTTTETKQPERDCLGFENNRNNMKALTHCIVLGVEEGRCIG